MGIFKQYKSCVSGIYYARSSVGASFRLTAVIFVEE